MRESSASVASAEEIVLSHAEGAPMFFQARALVSLEGDAFLQHWLCHSGDSWAVGT